MNDRTDWLTWRRQGIGASDVAALVGLSPWASAWSVWADKVGLVPLDDETPDEALEAGRWLERAIAPWFAERTGLHIAGEQTRCAHATHHHHRCTVDGFVFETDHADFPEAALGVLEIKHEAFGRPWESIPAHYQCQAQWSMHVTGTERVFFAVLHGRQLRHYVLERDDADIDYLFGVVETFWNDHVLTGVPPIADASEATARAIAAAYPGGEPDAVDLDAGLVARWSAIKAVAKAAAEDLAMVEGEIKIALGDHGAGAVHGVTVCTWRPQSRRGDLDADALAADGIEVDKYRKPSTTFRVLRTVVPRKETT